ncbi:sulfatase-like hydrolase/transferase [Verrucomicrobiales bacterium]|nr:sulfatase-like hydrolase/transferase [Verrucomicrobiales bacterium]
MKISTHSLLVACCAALPVGTTQAAPPNAVRPNVILVMTDDQGYGDLGCHGNPVLKTPVIDQLHAESIRFTDFHASPFCTPTRASVMTGNHAGRTGAFRTTGGRSAMHIDEKTIANLFADNGYATGMMGKWHLGDNAPHRPQDRGFQDVVWHRCGGIGQASDYWGNTYFDDTYERARPGSKVGKWEKFKGYCTDVFFEEGLRFVEENKEKPFFLYLSLNAPHGPYRVAPEWAAPYKEDPEWAPFANFYGMIANIDHNMGILRERLDEMGLTENTILIFMTDNGTAAGGKFNGLESEALSGYNAGMRGKKSSIFEGGTRVPFFIHWPKGELTGGKDIDTLAAHIDVLPTLAELCDISVPEGYDPDGQSVVPLLKDGKESWSRDHLIVQFHGGAYGRNPLDKPFADTKVLTERWRLTNSSKMELHEIEADPAQRNDLSAEHPEVISRLKALYEPFWESVSPRLVRPANIDLGNPSHNPTELCSQDWFMKTGYPPYAFSQISKLPRVTAPWLVDVKQAGRYRLTLRQWPEAADNPLVAVRAKVAVSGQEHEVEVPPNSKGVVIEMDLPKGPSELWTYLFDENGKAGGAYFTEVEFLAKGGAPLKRAAKPKPLVKTAPKGPFVEIETADVATGFKRLPLPVKPFGTVTGKYAVKDAPMKSLVDGKFAKAFGPVFANGVLDGAYKMDLGSVQPVAALTSWSFNMGKTRGAQKIALYGSDSENDPGWDLEAFTPLGKIDTTDKATAPFTAAALRAEPGKSLGKFRWIVWSVSPVYDRGGGENTAFQELAVETGVSIRPVVHAAVPSEDSEKAFPAEKTDFRGYDRYDRVKTASGHMSVVCPKKAAPGKPWLWRSLFWEAVPKFSNADLQLVEQGYHVVLAHGNVHGHPSGNANIDAAYELLTTEYDFSKKCSMASMSRGTLSLFTWASLNPEKVSCIYVDNGVCNIRSWPGGALVAGSGSVASGAPKSWEGMKAVYGFTTDQELLNAKVSPIDKLEPLAKAGVPILMVCGSKDPAVPYEENDAIMEARYKKLGGSIKVIVEDKGHSHGMKDPAPVLDFIRTNTAR